tara:strand:+ start:206 stop:463 length:258 start_codon:yes stop_codon:yes gene_type:complete
MVKASGWIVAVLVAVIAVLSAWIKRIRRTGQKQVQNPPIDETLHSTRVEVTEATEEEINAIWDDLTGDTPAQSIADEANKSRRRR